MIQPLGRHILKRTFSNGVTIPRHPQNFKFWPTFLSSAEQRVLLAAALEKLDNAETRPFRRRRKEYVRNMRTPFTSLAVQDLFFPDEYYDFQEGHYDGVIRHYREMHVTSWNEEIEGLRAIMNRLYSLCPTPKIQTHLLHLASNGEIYPHVDNLSASGSWILGVSIGSERTLRMEGPSEEDETFDVKLPSGSVYLQRDSMRYNYKHSILARAGMQPSSGAQRLSLMIRDLPLRDTL